MTQDQTFRIRGVSQAAIAPATHQVAVVNARRLLPDSARDAGGTEVTVAADDVVRLTLANGFILWTRADDLVRERGHQGSTRGGGDAWEIDTRAPEHGRNANRGSQGLGVTVLEFFGIDLKGLVAGQLAKQLEERQFQGLAPGLYRCALGETFELTALSEPVPGPADPGPVLLFIHGTGSSCQGSFGALWAPGSPAAKTAREELARRYGGRALAWEHRSLTQSPVVNALELVRTLPAGADLHLLTQSRGGLVGELLCLAERDRATDPLRADLLDTLFAADRTLAPQLGLGRLDTPALAARDSAYQADRQALAELLTVLDEKKLRISRFLRVACPARGTTLAAGRLDRWLSMFGHLGGWGSGGDALDFVLAVVKERTDPRTLPGLEAMMPGSALTRLLHHPDLSTRADLTVIAGEVAGDSLLGQLKCLIADWFYGADHDLVVTTGSMFGGIRRPAKGARFLRDRGAEVNHFSYFKNERTLRWLTAGLARADGADGGFQAIEQAPQALPRWRESVRRSRSAGTPKPLVVILPGVMGSTLQIDGREIWLNYWALLRGGIARLRLERTAMVEPTGPLDAFYGPLIEFLARSHRVEVFAYDWRLSVRTAARALAERLEGWLPEAERTKQPVRLVAHGMGGLVVRAMLADGDIGANLWRRIVDLPESRLLMLGTPHQGSYEAMRWLTGRNPSLAKLSLLDLTQGPDDLIDIVRTYPGLLELLPNAPEDPDLSRPEFWQDLKQSVRARWNVADTAVLRQARETWTLLRSSPVDPLRMICVAGHQETTVASFKLIDGSDPKGTKRLDFLTTDQGDGTVTWRSEVLPQVPVWYLEDTAHEALCSRQAAFPGYLDLLLTGKTARLSQTPPGGARAATGSERELLRPLPDRPPADDLPNQELVETLAFGTGLPADETDGTAEVMPLIRISIRHGDLSYARYPVLVGHYQGDTIVSAEQALDQRLAGRLTEHMQLGLYPGPPGTHALFFNERPWAKPAGAVVVGLGQVGDLTPVLLETGVRDALLECALRIAHWPDARFGEPGAVRSAAFSCLLVGTGAGGVRVADSVRSILRGALAGAERLAQAGLEHRVAIDRIEFIELYEDLAIAAVEALEGELRDEQLAARIDWPRRVLEDGEGGQRRIRFDEAPGWWQRLEIIQEPRGDALRFIASTDRARAEVTLAAGQLRLADDFIAQASRSPTTNNEAAKTLFEMLLPNRLRELAPLQRDLVLLVDEVSARFPWELLEDRWSRTGRPPATAAGLVRQFKTLNYRSNPAYAQEAKALVVGNPDLDGWEEFPDLPGARDEAHQVAALLRGKKFQVLDRIDEKADAILGGLHQDAWRILHLAGHGVHEYPVRVRTTHACAACGQVRPTAQERISGMVIGQETLLTPGDVEQMRWVPELVFINCCHLAKTKRATPTRFNWLAANLALQFVRMGAKAVIAAGWAVDDAAGLAFARGFYTRLLAGQSFGEAVRAAREEVWQCFGQVNTWGAYQCYGDPAYSLRLARSDTTQRSYHTPYELIVDLTNLQEEMRTQARAQGDDLMTADGLRAAIEDRIGGIPEPEQTGWLARADLAAALGFAWGEARAYKEAVTWLDRALAAEIGDCPVRALEQCNDFRLRLFSEEWRTLRDAPEGYEKEDQRQALVNQLESIIAELIQICQRTPTAERLALIGQACGELAWLQTEPRGRLEALVNMAQYLERARQASGPTGSHGDVALWAAAKLLALDLDPTQGGPWQVSLGDDLRSMVTQAAARNAQDPSFRNAVAVPNTETVLLLTQTDPPADAAQRIAGLYQDVFRRGASPRAVASVHEFLDFLIALGDRWPDPVYRTIVAIRSLLL